MHIYLAILREFLEKQIDNSVAHLSNSPPLLLLYLLRTQICLLYHHHLY